MRTGPAEVTCCRYCGQPIRTIVRAAWNIPTSCRACFGPQAYERHGPSWDDALHHQLRMAEGGEEGEKGG